MGVTRRRHSRRSPVALLLVLLKAQECTAYIGSQPCITVSKPRQLPVLLAANWETLRVDQTDDAEGAPAPTRGAQLRASPRYAEVHRFELGILRRIQLLPGFSSVSLAVHYSLLPKVITPLLALIVWLNSLPRGASIITFVCASDCLNCALKWAVQRPRPRWYAADAGLRVASCGAWEVDLSFPSAHTQARAEGRSLDPPLSAAPHHIPRVTMHMYMLHVHGHVHVQ